MSDDAPTRALAVKAESKEGQIAGYEVVDFKARLIDGKYHGVDSSALAFEIATRQCFREAQKLSKPKLLEPIMRLEVVMEADYLGDVIGDINRRRGTFTMEFDHYEEVPAGLVEKLMEKEAK